MNNFAICIVGTLIPDDEFNRFQKKSKEQSSTSPIVMQKNIFTGLKMVCNQVEYISYPPVAAFPRSPVLSIKGSRLYIDSNLSGVQIPIINLPILKQISVFWGMLIHIMRWAMRNRRLDRRIMTYADFTEYCLPALMVGRLFKIPVSLFLTELPGYEHYHIGKMTPKDRLIVISEKLKMKLYGKYSGYVFVSDHLKDAVPIRNAPYTVVEGFAESDLWNGTKTPKDSVRTIMYAGSLGEAYNIRNVCDAFHSIEGNYQLWIFGDGKYRGYVQEAQKRDSRISYFGKVSREEVLSYEAKAHVLLHAKTSADDHSQYAFSNKILEYMASGTAVLSTRVRGIPDEYFDHMFVIEDESVNGIASAIKNTLDLPDSDLYHVASEARRFVLYTKDKRSQALKIIEMMSRMS